MTRQMSKGKCSFCNGTFSKVTMAKHLKSCNQREVVLDTSSEERKSQKTKGFHLVVEGHYAPAYWIHLSAPANATLKDLDRFLRDIWLECCGHLSAFTIKGLLTQILLRKTSQTPKPLSDIAGFLKS